MALGSVLVTLATLELALRLLLPPSPLPAGPILEDRATDSAETQSAADGPRPVLKAQIHPFLGWAGRPGHSWQGTRSIPSRNRLGLGSTIWDYQDLDPEAYVVGIFGGSVALSLALDAPGTLARRLEELSPDLAGRVRVISCAEGGYKQPQQLNLLSELLLLGVPFDVVVNLDGFNEVALADQNARRGVHPILPSRSHLERLIRVANESPAEDDLLLAAEVVTRRREATAAREWLARSQLARIRLARELVVRWVLRNERLANRAERAIGEGGDSSDLLANLSDPCLEKPASCRGKEIEIWARASLAMDAVSRAFGARYVHFLQPNQHLKGTKALSEEERRSFYSPQRSWSRSYASAWRDFQREGSALRAQGVDFRDLTGIFREHTETLYRDSCCHLNQRGNDLLASAIAEALAR